MQAPGQQPSRRTVCIIVRCVSSRLVPPLTIGAATRCSTVLSPRCVTTFKCHEQLNEGVVVVVIVVVVVVVIVVVVVVSVINVVIVVVLVVVVVVVVDVVVAVVIHNTMLCYYGGT